MLLSRVKLTALVTLVFGLESAAIDIGPEGSRALLQFKQGVELDGVSPHIQAALEVIVPCFHSLNINTTPVITSGSEYYSWRAPWSLHKAGQAIDLRGKDKSIELLHHIRSCLSAELGPSYDVIVENYGEHNPNTHIHIEYDPKPKS